MGYTFYNEAQRGWILKRNPMKAALVILIILLALVPITSAQGLTLTEDTVLVESCECSEMFARQYVLWHGKYLAIGNNAGTNIDSRIQVWDMSSNDQIAVMGGGIASITWSPSGDRLAIANTDGSIDIWTPETDRTQLTAALTSGPLEIISWVGDTLLVAGESLWLVDAESGALIDSIDITTTGIAALSPDGNRVAAVSPNDTIYIFNLIADELEWEFNPGDGGVVRRLKWAPGSGRLAVIRQDAPLRVWNLTSAEIMYEVDSSDAAITDVSWSIDGQYLALTGLGVTVVDAQTGQEMASANPRDVPVTGVGWSPNSGRLVTIDAQDMIQVWSVE
jgi:WD40 repeat protein